MNDSPPLISLTPVNGVTVLGLGLIGGSILKALDGVCGWDPDANTRELATLDGFDIAPTLEAAVSGSEFAVVAAPPSACAASIVAALGANADVTVIDVCSVKAALVNEVQRAAPDSAARYVPAHPLAGAAAGGYLNSAATLLVNAPWAVCPHPLLAGEHLWQGMRLITALSGSVIGCPPAFHDRVVAHASHAVQLVSSTLASYTPDDLFTYVAALHGGGLRDATRVAASDPSLWTDIIRHNANATTEAIDDLIADLTALRGAISSNNWEMVEAALARGRARKAELDARRWTEGDWEDELWPLPELITRVLATGSAGLALRAHGVIVNDHVSVRVRHPL